MRKCLVQPINNIGIDRIADDADSEGPRTRQNSVKTQPSGGLNATLWFVIAVGRRDTMLVARETSDSTPRTERVKASLRRSLNLFLYFQFLLLQLTMLLEL